MDMEKLRKINDLANTLREKGLTTSRCEAAHIAGNLAGTAEEQEFSNSISFKMDESSPLRDAATPMSGNRIEAAAQKQDMKNYVDEKRLINILQEFTGVFEKRNEDSANELKAIINQQQERINELTSSLQLLAKKQEELKNNAAALAAAPAPVVQAPPAQPMEEDSLVSELIGEVAPTPAPMPVATPAPIAAAPAPAPVSEKKKSQAPRSSGVTSEDVDVQKFFYFGGK